VAVGRDKEVPAPNPRGGEDGAGGEHRRDAHLEDEDADVEEGTGDSSAILDAQSTDAYMIPNDQWDESSPSSRVPHALQTQIDSLQKFVGLGAELGVFGESADLASVFASARSSKSSSSSSAESRLDLELLGKEYVKSIYEIGKYYGALRSVPGKTSSPLENVVRNRVLTLSESYAILTGTKKEEVTIETWRQFAQAWFELASRSTVRWAYNSPSGTLAEAFTNLMNYVSAFQNFTALQVQHKLPVPAMVEYSYQARKDAFAEGVFIKDAKDSILVASSLTSVQQSAAPYSPAPPPKRARTGPIMGISAQIIASGICVNHNKARFVSWPFVVFLPVLCFALVE